jgi:hypothetical protein
VEARITKDDFEGATRGGVGLKDRVNLLSDRREHRLSYYLAREKTGLE